MELDCSNCSWGGMSHLEIRVCHRYTIKSILGFWRVSFLHMVLGNKQWLSLSKQFSAFPLGCYTWWWANFANPVKDCGKLYIFCAHGIGSALDFLSPYDRKIRDTRLCPMHVFARISEWPGVLWDVVRTWLYRLLKGFAPVRPTVYRSWYTFKINGYGLGSLHLHSLKMLPLGQC